MILVSYMLSQLVGLLKLNKKTANIQIVDRTGALDLICISRDDEDVRSDDGNFRSDNGNFHCCQFCASATNDSKECDLNCKRETYKEDINCPSSCFVQCCDIGSLVAITEFDLVIESSGESKPNCDTDYKHSSFNHRVYVIFSMKEVLRLSTPVLGTARTEYFSGKRVSHIESKRSLLLSDSENIICDKFRRLSCESKSKEVVSDKTEVSEFAPNSHKGRGTKPESDLKGIVSKLKRCDITESCSVIQDFIVLHKDSLTVKSQGSADASPRLCFYCLVYFVGDARMVSNLEKGECQENEEPADTQKSQVTQTSYGTQVK